MDAGIIVTLFAQVITLSVMVALFLGLMRVLRQDIREVRDIIKEVNAKLGALLVNMAVMQNDMTVVHEHLGIEGVEVPAPSPPPVAPPPPPPPYPVSPPAVASAVTAEPFAESG